MGGVGGDSAKSFAQRRGFCRLAEGKQFPQMQRHAKQNSNQHGSCKRNIPPLPQSPSSEKVQHRIKLVDVNGWISQFNITLLQNKIFIFLISSSQDLFEGSQESLAIQVGGKVIFWQGCHFFQCLKNRKFGSGVVSYN